VEEFSVVEPFFKVSAPGLKDKKITFNEAGVW
jgi:hypothetical protein